MVVPINRIILQVIIMSDILGLDVSDATPPTDSGRNGAPITILSLSADEQDHSSLATIFASSHWEVLRARDFAAARPILLARNVAVLVCDSDSTPEPWAEILDAVQQMQPSAPVVITSRLADDRLWSQALHLGAWDVLAKPFRAAEVVRSIRYAWEHWRNQHRVRPAAKAMSGGV